MFLGSTSFLVPFTCQNDIWLNEGDPSALVNGDRRLIIQSLHEINGILYQERWEGGSWRAVSIPEGIEVYIEGNLSLPMALPPGDIVNPNQDNAVYGVFIEWIHNFELVTVPGTRLYYIKHAPRDLNPVDVGYIYMLPLEDPVDPTTLTGLRWNTQINQWRRGIPATGPELVLPPDGMNE